jgi:hypothetical protein
MLAKWDHTCPCCKWSNALKFYTDEQDPALNAMDILSTPEAAWIWRNMTGRKRNMSILQTRYNLQHTTTHDRYGFGGDRDQPLSKFSIYRQSLSAK